MDNPGIFSLGDLAITAADTYIGDVISNLHGMTAVTIQLRFAWTSGGSSARVYIQTSLDQENTWVDLACISCVNAAETAILNLSGLTPKTSQVTPSDGALGDDLAVDGILGDCLRMKIVTTGTYANTVASGRVAVR